MNPAQAELMHRVQDLIAQTKKMPIDAYEISARLSMGFEVTARHGDVENLEHHRGQAIIITVYKEQRTASASTSDLSSSGVLETLRKACSMVEYAEQDVFAGLADPSLLVKKVPELQLFHAWDISPEQAIALAVQCDQAASALDKRVIQTEEAAVTTGNTLRVYANSHHFLENYWSSFHGLSASVIAESHGQMQQDYEACYARAPSHLPSPEQVAQRVVTRAVRKLDARKISTRRCPVIFEARVAKSLLNTFINAISGRNLYRHHSFLENSLGKAIFPSKISIYQRPHIIGGYGSIPFDSEGVATQDLHYVQDGVISNYVLGSYSARKLGMTSTGNAGGVYNLFVTHDDKTLANLCAEINTGLLVTDLLGQGINLLTGDYSRGAAGFWVENGEIQFPVHEVTIAGHLSEIFSQIISIGNDADEHANIRTGSIAVAEMVVAGE